MIENNLDNLIATPVSLKIAYGKKYIDLEFQRVSQGMRQRFFQKFGGKTKFQKALENFDMDVISSMLYMLLPLDEKQKLLELKDAMRDEDEEGNEFYIAETKFEIFKTILTPEVNIITNLLLQVSGLDSERAKEVENMPNKKKEELFSMMEELTTPKSTPES